MIFLKNKTNSIPIGTKRKRSKFCILPFNFDGNTYFLHRVFIVEVYEKDAISVLMDGGGYMKNGWKIKKVYSED